MHLTRFGTGSSIEVSIEMLSILAPAENVPRTLELSEINGGG
jgi:hypothetical protein